MKRMAASLLTVILLLAGCSSGKPIAGNSYVFENDDQYYFAKSNGPGSGMAASETGYYFFSGHNESYLYYLDKATMKTVLMCNKPDCLHTEETSPYKVTYCNAFFNSSSAYLTYYDSSLYVVDAIDMSLYQISLDATKRKRLLSFKEEIYNMIIHRGYIYYTVNESANANNRESPISKIKVCRIDLGNTGKEPELLFEYEGYRADIVELKAYRDSVYFLCDYYTDSEMTAEERYMYKYDTITNQCQKLIEIAGTYMFYDDTIIFSDPYSDPKFQVYTCKLDGSCIKKMDNVYGSVKNADGDYPYLYDFAGGNRKSRLHVYD